MNQCPKCHKTNTIKAGYSSNKKRYKCKNCIYYYTVSQKSGSADLAKKRQALQLYLEGLGFRAIARIVNFSHVAVYNWIKDYGKNLDLLHSKQNIDTTEIDEMHSYIGSKKTLAGSGSLLIDRQKNSSTSRLAIDPQVLEKNFGKE
jgi:transposase